MAIEGAPQILVGGAVSTGPASGDYHVICSDAATGISSTGRPNLQLELTVKNDDNHAAKNGKKLTRMFQSLPGSGDDDEKVKQILGMVKRLAYDGFGVKWPAEPKPIDPRIFVGKTAFVRLAQKPGDDRTNVVAVAASLEKLPVMKGAEAKPVNGNGSVKAPRR